MKPHTAQLLSEIDDAHDFGDEEVQAHGGTAFSSKAQCRVCGIEQAWYTDPQDGISGTYTYTDRGGQRLSLTEATRCE